MSTDSATSPVSNYKRAKVSGAPGRAAGAGGHGLGIGRRVALTLIYFTVVSGLVASRRANLVVAMGAGNALILALTATPAAGRSGVMAKLGGAAVAASLGFGVTVGAFHLAYYLAYCLMFIAGKLLGW